MTEFNSLNRRKTKEGQEQADKNLCKLLSEFKEANEEELKWRQVLKEVGDMPVIGFEQENAEEEDLEDMMVKLFGWRLKGIERYEIERRKRARRKVDDWGGKEIEVISAFFVLEEWEKIEKVVQGMGREGDTWRCWLELIKEGRARSRAYGDDEYSKVAEVYRVLYSKGWGANRKAMKAAEEVMEDIRGIIKADILIYGNDKNSESVAVSMLKEAINGRFKRLGFYKLVSLYLDYNDYQEVLGICEYVKNNFKGEIKEIATALLTKIEGKLRRITGIRARSNLLDHYYFSRACVKYLLPVSLDQVKASFAILEKSLIELNSYDNLFEVKFWEFLMYKQENMELKAIEVGKCALKYKNSCSLKVSVISSYINSVEALISLVSSSNLPNERLDLSPYLSLVIKLMEELKEGQPKSLQIFEEILNCPLKYEGIMINWYRAYKLNKTRESKYKVKQNCYPDKTDPNHPLFYYKIFKNYLSLIEKALNYYVSLNINSIWRYFGKKYYDLNLLDSFTVIQAKSYLRSNLFKSVKKIKKACVNDCHPLIKFYFIKYKIEVIKLNQEFSTKKIWRIFTTFNQVFNARIDKVYRMKSVYYMAEVYFLQKCFDKSLECFTEAKKLNAEINSSFILAKKRMLTERLLLHKHLRHIN